MLYIKYDISNIIDFFIFFPKNNSVFSFLILESLFKGFAQCGKS